MLTVPEVMKMKVEQKKISMMTCYDASFAHIANESQIDLLLVGDSSAMVMHGYDSTLHATVDMIEVHVKAVSKAAKKMIIADMPFLSTRKDRASAVEAAGRLMCAGAHAVKIEGIDGHDDLVRHLVDSGIPVMGHLGLTPQSVNSFGGMKVQGKSPAEFDKILLDSKRFERAGAFSLVLECVPSTLGKAVTHSLVIPTIGIGAGVDCDGQVLVLQDLLGFRPDFKPRFLRRYFNGFETFKSAFDQFNQDVKDESYPSKAESYSTEKQ